MPSFFMGTIWPEIQSFESIITLTSCGFMQWIDLGEAIGVDIIRTTCQVSESDLEAQCTQTGSLLTKRFQKWW